MIDVKIRGVFERDIDLLLLEEFVASPDFLRWFLGELGLEGSAQLRAAARSVPTSTGETDLELTVVQKERVTKLLIENKVDAILQPRQPERYAERAVAYLECRECDKVLTVLIAPEVYVRSALAFDRRITYESVLQWFESRPDGTERLRFKRLVLEEAIERGSVGWTLVPNETTTNFWREYWELVTSDAPELGMPQPDTKPATSGFLRFRAVALPRGIELIHKVPYGNVDLQFAGIASRADEFVRRFIDKLEPGMQIQRANKSLVVRISVPKIELKSPFQSSEESVRKGIQAAKQLLAWYDRVRPGLDAT